MTRSARSNCRCCCIAMKPVTEAAPVRPVSSACRRSMPRSWPPISSLPARPVRRCRIARPGAGWCSACALEAARLPPVDRGGCAILGTVPPQHMYGFESTVLLPLQSGGALCAERPFFPADIAAALAELPRPRVLITTPVHLRSLLTAEIALPALDLIVSATAMLPTNLAREVEQPLRARHCSRSTARPKPARWPRAARRSRITGGCGPVCGWNSWTSAAGPRAGTSSSHGRWPTCSSSTGARALPAARAHRRPGQHRRQAQFARLSQSSAQRHTRACSTAHSSCATTAHASLAGVTRLAALVVAPGLDAAAHHCRRCASASTRYSCRGRCCWSRHLPRNETGKLPQHTLRALVAQAAARAPHLFA